MLIRFGLLFIVAAVVAGCSRNTSQELPPLHPAKGKITHNGKTVGKGHVRFTPETNQDYTIFSQVDENGAFDLVTVRGGKESKGAPAGEFKVFYIPDTGGEQSVSAPIETTKTFTIEAKPNELTIELTAK
jgi:hypothetical protein